MRFFSLTHLPHPRPLPHGGRGATALWIALSLFLVGCQFQPRSAAVPAPETSNSGSETLSNHPQSGLQRHQISIQSNSGNIIEILAEIADEPEAHAQGLMYRRVLPEGEGMLFVFPEEAPRSFWMKNTIIPLDILFFDASGTWVSGVTMPPCEDDPCPSYPSASPAKYALEVPAGSIQHWGVGEVWTLTVSE